MKVKVKLVDQQSEAMSRLGKVSIIKSRSAWSIEADLNNAEARAYLMILLEHLQICYYVPHRGFGR